MTTSETASRALIPGTTGWSAADLSDPVLAAQWESGRFEIIAGVPNYWVLDVFARSLICFVLAGAQYRVEQSGTGDEELRPSCFPGLVIPLAPLWRI